MKQTAILIGIFAFALALRLIHLQYPFFDHASVRSVETFTIAKNFITQGLPIWRPRVDWGGPNGGFVKFEFQLYTWMLAGLMRLFGILPVVGRLFTISISLASGWLLYDLLRSRFAPLAALFGTAVYLLNPVMVYFGRAIQPDSMMVFFGILGIWFAGRKEKLSLFDVGGSVCAVAVAVMLKPTAALFLAPVIVLLFGVGSWKELLKSMAGMRIIAYAAVVLAVIAPAVVYYSYIDRAGDMSLLHHPSWWISLESIMAYAFNPLYQKYLAAAMLFFNPIGWLLLAAGLFLRYRKKDFFVIFFLCGAWAFIIAMSPMSFQMFHEWHLMLIVPAMGFVAAKIVNDGLFSHKAIMALSVAYIALLPLAIYGLFFISNARPDIVYENVRILKQYIPEGEVAAVTDSNSTLTNFYSGRIGVYFGGEITEAGIRGVKNRGAGYIMVTRPPSATEQRALDKYPLIYNNGRLSVYEIY